MKKKPRNHHSTSTKGRSYFVNNDNKNNRKGVLELSLPLVFSFWCLVFLFHSKLGLTHGNGGNLQVENRSMTNSSARDDKLYDSAYSLVENENNSYVNRVLLEFNASITSNDSHVLDHHPSTPEHSLRGTSEWEEAVKSFLGYPVLVCGMQHQEQQKQKTLHQIGKTHSPYLNLDEFRNITRQEKGGIASNRLANITHRLEPDGTSYNYASATKGAKVVTHNKEAKGASNILGKDHDKYLRNPCSVGGKFVIIELAEETLVDTVKIANFEHYSSNFKEFELYGSLVYPTETWSPIGKFVAANAKNAQSFKLPEPKWVRYLKLNLLSHYGSEFYCTMSVVEVYGVDAIERMLEDLIVASELSATVKLPDPNSTVLPSSIPESEISEQKIDGEVQKAVHTSSQGIEGIDKPQKPNLHLKSPVTSNIPDPVMEIRQQPNGRIHGDAALKILMQKVRSLEINLSVLEEYIKELNRRQGDVVPELEKELSRYSMLLEKSRSDINELLEWKKIMDKGVTDLEVWKAVVSSRMDEVVRENGMLRLDVEKVVSDQASLEKKEIAVLAASFCFAFLAIVRLVSERVLMSSGAPVSGNLRKPSRGWILILVSSSMTIFITLL
ncbi:SUN domain-containing protein 5 isoform X1 [Rhododendron vialii]|uniref:SUN domain-containing protein 5 isoform X1 n=1 Tax=Rhododendron vialii TaxID=182163 RepID=UPI00265F3028|nr:SUN domain-containing protein 5 isoform X1 [Rhododendron vialii]